MNNKSEGKLEQVSIRHAVPEDAEAIIEFLRQHWIIENHVFTRRRDLFDNCHLIEGRLTFVLAIGNESGRILGLIGYSFNNHDFDCPDISAVIFQTLKTANPSLGIDMIRALQKLTNARSLFCPGIVKSTTNFYRFLGYETGMLRHYYRLGPVDSFHIARIGALPSLCEAALVPFELRKLSSFDEVCAAFPFEKYRDVRPCRDEWSVRQRYFDNIGYEYQIFGVFDADTCKALLVGREVACSNAAMFRIVDYLGDDEAFAHLSSAFARFLDERDYEYIDFYEVGIDDEYLLSAGFSLQEDDTNIIPHFFEPFEQKNVEIWFYTTEQGKFHIYRTDSGQDRPNFIDEIGA